MEIKDIKAPIPTQEIHMKLEATKNPFKDMETITPNIEIPASWLLELGFEPGATIKITAGEKYLSMEQVEEPGQKARDHRDILQEIKKPLKEI